MKMIGTCTPDRVSSRCRSKPFYTRQVDVEYEAGRPLDTRGGPGIFLRGKRTFWTLNPYGANQALGRPAADGSSSRRKRWFGSRSRRCRRGGGRWRRKQKVAARSAVGFGPQPPPVGVDDRALMAKPMPIRAVWSC